MENSVLNALIAFGLALLLIVAGIRDVKTNGLKVENALTVIGGMLIMFFSITIGFWPVTDLGFKFLAKGAERAQVDDVLSNGVDNVLDGDILAVNDSVQIQERSDTSGDSHSSGPASDTYTEDGANIEIIKPTPAPTATPIKYHQEYEKPVVAWGNWFRGNHYHTNGDATSAQIPIGVRCAFAMVDDPWFGPQEWQMTCNDRENSDYGIVKITLTEAAVKGLGAMNGKALDGTGDLGPRHYPKGIFIQVDQQSQAPASAPGPAPVVSTGDGPDALTSVFTSWLVIDAPAGIPCVWDNGSKILASGTKHRFDPRSIRNNRANEVPRVEVLMNVQGTTCWAQIWRGLSHIQ